MAGTYDLGSQYMLVWCTGDKTVDGILATVLAQYNFTLDPNSGDYGVYYLEVPEGFNARTFMLMLEEQYDLYDIEGNLWNYLYSYQYPIHG